jgi:molybdopterin converting factor small subunit
VRIELHLFATLASFLPPASAGGTATIDLPEAATLDDLRRAVGIPDGLAYVALVNGHEATCERRLDAGDVVTLFPPLAGGSRRGSVAPALRGAQRGWYTAKRPGSV